MYLSLSSHSYSRQPTAISSIPHNLTTLPHLSTNNNHPSRLRLPPTNLIRIINSLRLSFLFHQPYPEHHTAWALFSSLTFFPLSTNNSKPHSALATNHPPYPDITQLEHSASSCNKQPQPHPAPTPTPTPNHQLYPEHHPVWTLFFLLQQQSQPRPAPITNYQPCPEHHTYWAVLFFI